MQGQGQGQEQGQEQVPSRHQKILLFLIQAQAQREQRPAHDDTADPTEDTPTFGCGAHLCRKAVSSHPSIVGDLRREPR